MIPSEKIQNPEVREYAEEARDLIESQPWCRQVTAIRLAWATAGILGVFEVDLQPDSPGVDPTLWVVVGDLPPAYLVLDEAPTWRDALRGYIAEMSHWVHAVKNGLPLDDVIPVDVEPTLKHADMLAYRLSFIEKEIIDAPDREGDA